MLAGAQSDAGKYADAENTLKQGIAVLGKVPDLLINRGIIYARQARPQLAARDFAAVREKYTDPEVLNSMCWAIATAGVALDTALSACEAALAQRPQDSAFLDSRGFVLLRLGRYDEAIAAYDAAIKITADRGMSLYGRGVSKRRKGDLAGGDADLEAALALNRSVAATFAHYGVTP
jgi:tetratricopeptide (TPR) repeat protein